MAEPENSQILPKQEYQSQPTNVFSLIPKFNLQLPFFRPSQSQSETVQPEKESKTTVGVERDQNETLKPNVVRFPKTEPIVPPPLEAEADESTKTSNPVILWQVYALGGFLVLRWIWARWNERKARGKSSDDEGRAQGRPSEDDRSPDPE